MVSVCHSNRESTLGHQVSLDRGVNREGGVFRRPQLQNCYKTKIPELCSATHMLQKRNVEPEGPAFGVTQSDPTYTVKLNGVEPGEAIHTKP